VVGTRRDERVGHSALDAVRRGERLADDAVLSLIDADVQAVCALAAAVRDQGHGGIISYSRKVFIPLTRLCRDVCHYCTFAQPPQPGESAYLSPKAVLEIARAGAASGCREALFTLGDQPERRYPVARDALDHLGYPTTLAYLVEAARLVLTETGLLPHVNPGVLAEADLVALRRVSVSQGLMLESISERLCEKGGPHHGSPDKRPSVRLATLQAAGIAAVPFTTGLLIGIGETRQERLEALLAIRDLHERYGHIQEIIVQNFRAKPGTRMALAPEPDLAEQCWTIAVARLIFGPAMTIQAPPNLRPDGTAALIGAGINDWGGVSPVTPDHVNPEAPWPHLEVLAAQTAAAGKTLTERLAIHPPYVRASGRWLDPALRTAVLRAVDAAGYVRDDQGWRAGAETPIPAALVDRVGGDRRRPAVWSQHSLGRTIDRAHAGHGLAEGDIVRLFMVRGEDLAAVCAAADDLRRRLVGETVTYVVNRNINYTNICSYRCRFCAFSKGKTHADLRGAPYDLALEEVVRRAVEAWARGATEVCLQGGIHPDYTGETYLELCRALKAVMPSLHIHAFSPLEISQGARTLGLPLEPYLARLREAGLGSLPGTAAEILDDEVRAVLCPDKLNTAEWFAVMTAAHAVGLRSTATIMFGHIDRPEHWARHLLRLRAHQIETGGFTEFVPLPFVAAEAPIYLKGQARSGPTAREAVLMHAVARLVFGPVIPNIQTSWVKLGVEGAALCLQAGANDLGGTLMNESITRAAGASHGQEMPPERMTALISRLGRTPAQRTTLYGTPPPDRMAASFGAAPLAPVVNTPPTVRTRAPATARGYGGAETGIGAAVAGVRDA